MKTMPPNKKLGTYKTQMSVLKVRVTCLILVVPFVAQKSEDTSSLLYLHMWWLSMVAYSCNLSTWKASNIKGI